MEVKYCNKCEQSKPIDRFGLFNRRGYGLRRQSYCKDCRTRMQTERDKANPIQKRAHSRRMKLKRKYGISPAEWQAQYLAQRKACAVCQKSLVGLSPQTVHVDHNHATGELRGILCGSCNVGLGSFRDDESTLMAAINYLKSNGCWVTKLKAVA